jgi:gamma-glutamyltranspeptidase/glutathione hydrolase
MTSGLGSETLILIRMADGRLRAIDGSSFVPNLANRDELHRLRDAAPRGYLQDYKSIAVPGSLAALAYAIQRYGSKPLPEVMAPAINLADFGFKMTVTSTAEIDGLAYLLRPHEHLADLLLRDFTDTWGPDHVFCGAEVAATLRRIAASGPDEFYRGSIADEIDADMTLHKGYMRKADLVTVRAVERQPIRDTYRGLEVISFPSPGGGASLVELLHILEEFPPKLLHDESLDRLHLLIEAARIALVDAQDPKRPPFILDRHLTDRGWAAERARLIRFDRTLRPEEISGETVEPYLTLGTTQVSVVDRWGNVVGLAQTLGGFFGAGVITPGLGFIYNSNLNAFSFTNPSDPHYATPGRAAITALAPTIILKEGRPLLVVGSAGSERVIPTLASVVTSVADRNLGPREAVGAPRVMWGTNWGDPRAFAELAGEITPEKVDALEKRGFRDIYRLMFPARWMDISAFGGTNSVFIDPATGVATGVADPRRSGAAAAPAF